MNCGKLYRFRKKYMDFENLFTEKTTINISVVKLNAQKINKTVFNQLLIFSPFNNIFDLRPNIKVLGYVNDKMRWVLWIQDNSIFKYPIKELKEFAFFDIEYGKTEEFIELYPENKLSFFNRSNDDWDDEISSDRLNLILTNEEKTEILAKQDYVSNFLSHLTGRQIFL